MNTFFSFLSLTTILVLSACAAGSNYQPTTKEGIQCKIECSHSMSNCHASSYTCDRAISTCMQSCKELEEINKKSL